MKTIFMTLIFAFTTMLTFAQTSEHLTFKGVPIDGTLDEYVSKMKKSGFTHTGTNDGIAFLNGDFAGYKDCTVGVATLKQKDLVNHILVQFPEGKTWSILSGYYFDLKQKLTEKYGKPYGVVEEFDVESFQLPLDDNDKMHQVKMGNCKYYSFWEMDKGRIILSINHSGIGCYVTLSYFDKINTAKIEEKAIDDL